MGLCWLGTTGTTVRDRILPAISLRSVLFRPVGRSGVVDKMLHTSRRIHFTLMFGQDTLYVGILGGGPGVLFNKTLPGVCMQLRCPEEKVLLYIA